MEEKGLALELLADYKEDNESNLTRSRQVRLLFLCNNLIRKERYA